MVRRPRVEVPITLWRLLERHGLKVGGEARRVPARRCNSRAIQAGWGKSPLLVPEVHSPTLLSASQKGVRELLRLLLGPSEERLRMW